MARPQADIDEEQLRRLAERLWTTEQIASFFRCHRSTIEKRFSEVLHQGRQAGCAKLIDIMWERIHAGSEKMLEHALNRFIGPIPKKIELTKEQAIEFLETELERSGENPDASEEG